MLGAGIDPEICGCTRASGPRGNMRSIGFSTIRWDLPLRIELAFRSLRPPCILSYRRSSARPSTGEDGLLRVDDDHVVAVSTCGV